MVVVDRIRKEQPTISLTMNHQLSTNPIDLWQITRPCETIHQCQPMIAAELGDRGGVR
jgi:hypothetical protein